MWKFLVLPHSLKSASKVYVDNILTTNLFIKFFSNSRSPLSVEVFGFGGSVNISKFDDHLSNQEPIRLRLPVNTHSLFIIHLQRKIIISLFCFLSLNCLTCFNHTSYPGTTNATESKPMQMKSISDKRD